jgi:hypothetical protein
MQIHSILAGKTYRTPDEEMREVTRIDGEQVIYRAVMATPGPGIIARPADKRLSIEQFAREVESEVGAQ